MLLHILIIIRNLFSIALQGIELELKYVMLFGQSLGHIFVSPLLFTNYLLPEHSGSYVYA